MEIDWEMSHINLDNLETISRGDSVRMLKYLEQFKTLIPKRLNQLVLALDTQDRMMIRQILHKMSPQLQFFGIRDVSTPIQRMEFEYESMPINELVTLVNGIITKLDNAVAEVSKLIDSNFE